MVASFQVGVIHEGGSLSLLFTLTLGAPPSYAFVTQVYQRNLRPVVMASETQTSYSCSPILTLQFFP